MSAKPKKNNAVRRAAPNKAAEDYTTNKILAIFTLTFVVLFMLVLLNRGYAHVGSYLISANASLIIFWVTAALTVLFAVLAVIRRRKGIVTQYKVFTPAHMCFASALAAVAAFAAMRYNNEGIQLMYAVIPSVAVLLLINMIYPRDFSVIALLSGCGILAMYIFYTQISELILWQRSFSFVSLAFTVVVLAALAAAAVFFGIMRRTKGTLVIKDARVEIFAKNTTWFFSFLTVGVIALCTVAAYVLGSVAAYYLMFLLLAYLFAMAVVYTVKML